MILQIAITSWFCSESSFFPCYSVCFPYLPNAQQFQLTFKAECNYTFLRLLRSAYEFHPRHKGVTPRIISLYDLRHTRSPEHSFSEYHIAPLFRHRFHCAAFPPYNSLELSHPRSVHLDCIVKYLVDLSPQQLCHYPSRQLSLSWMHFRTRVCGPASWRILVTQAVLRDFSL